MADGAGGWLDGLLSGAGDNWGYGFGPQRMPLTGKPEDEDKWSRQQGLNAMLSSMGGNMLGMAQGGMTLPQAAAMRARGMEQIGQAGMIGQQAQQQADASIIQRQQQATQSQLARARLSQMQQQLLMGQSLARMLVPGMGGDAAGGGAAAPQGIIRQDLPAPPGDGLDTAARVLQAEAGNQGPEGIAAVAHVIANRARLTGQSPGEVVAARGQFEPWGNEQTRAQLLAYRPEQYSSARQALEAAMSGQTPDPTGGATHFLNPDLQRQLGRAQPAWAPEGQGQRIGAHVFYSRPGDFGGQRAAAPLTPAQQTLAAPAGAGNARQSGNSVGNMPEQLRAMAAMRAASGDIEGATKIVSDWMTRTPPQVQMTEVGGRRREVLPNGELGRDYGPTTEQGPLLPLDQISSLGVPAQSARMIAGLSTRKEQDEAIRALASRTTTPVSEQEDGLRREFQALPPVTRYSQSLPLFQSINSSVERIRAARNSGTVDQLGELDMVIAIANLFDPGSVVREGEVANVIRTQGLSGDIQRALGYATSGQRMPVSVLDQVIASADDRMRAYQRAVEPYANAYRRTAEGRGLNAGNILLDLGDPLAERDARRAATAVAPPNPNARPPAGATAAEIAGRIKTLYPDPEARRRMATAAGIDPRLVE